MNPNTVQSIKNKYFNQIRKLSSICNFAEVERFNSIMSNMESELRNYKEKCHHKKMIRKGFVFKNYYCARYLSLENSYLDTRTIRSLIKQGKLVEGKDYVR